MSTGDPRSLEGWRWELDVWDDRTPETPPTPSPARRPSPAPRTPRIRVPPGPTGADIAAARAGSRLIGETGRAVHRAQAFAGMVRRASGALGAVLTMAALLDDRDDEFSGDRLQMEVGARVWLAAGLAAAREARDMVADDLADNVQNEINAAFNSQRGDIVGELLQSLGDLHSRLIQSRQHLERLAFGCDSAARSLLEAERMARQLTETLPMTGATEEAAEYLVFWQTIQGIWRQYRNAADEYFEALASVESDIQAIEPVVDDAHEAYWQIFGLALRDAGLLDQ